MNNELSNVSAALADAVETVGASVVRVEGRRRVAASGIVWSADGLIVTAHHVVERDEELQVGLPDGRAAAASLVGRDPSTDLALLRSEATGLVPPRWSDDAARVGNLALAIGRPGKSVQATIGIVSALGGAWRSPMGGEIDRYVQTDVVMYPGFSGGPLADASGGVLGLNTSALLRGYSLAVPAATIARVANALATHGRMRRGYLGIAAQLVRLPEAASAELQQDTGLMVMSVEKDGPADRGGLAMGDTIVAIDGRPMRDMDDLLAALPGDRIGSQANVRVLRGGSPTELSVTVGERI